MDRAQPKEKERQIKDTIDRTQNRQDRKSTQNENETHSKKDRNGQHRREVLDRKDWSRTGQRT
jgi:hypothetical protein